MSFDIDRLYSLLPEIYRIRDKEQGGQLKALLSVIADQVAVLEEDLSQLYDDQFIETCADWVVPYIGDLIGFRGIKTPEDISISQRAQVADTISIRKRKGTFSVIERIVRDATGWDCAAVECFRLIATTQNLNHLRPDNKSIADVHHWQSLLDTNRPFCIPSPTDRLAHNIDVRSISNESRSRGLYNIPNIAVFIWRLKAQLLKGSPAFKIDDMRYTFSPLGIDTQLFTGSEGTKSPMPISRSMLYSSLLYSSLNKPDGGLDIDADISAGIGADIDTGIGTGIDTGIGTGIDAISLMVNDTEVFPRGTINNKPVTVIACNLSDQHDDSGRVVGWAHTPVAEGIIALDPQLGRIAFPSTQSPASVRTTFFYGFCENMGGGKYARWESFSDFSGEGYDLISVKKKAGSEDDQKQIEEALAGLGTNGGVVEIGGSNMGDEERYELSSLVVDVSGGKRIEIRAAKGCRPLLVLDGEMEIRGDGGTVSLNGFVISGRGIRASAGLERLRISHCTLAQGLIPGRTDASSPSSSQGGSPTISPSIVVVSEGPASGITVEIEKSIVGPLRMPAEGALLVVRDSIVDSPSRERGARVFPALQSGLIESLPLKIDQPTNSTTLFIRPLMKVTIAGKGPHIAALNGHPGNLEEARAMVEAAIRGAHDSPGFRGARVIFGNGRLTILPGVPGDVVVENYGLCSAASLLKLDPESARKTKALIGGPLPVDLSLSSTSPAMKMYKEGGRLHTISFASSKNPAEVAAGIMASLQAFPEYKGTAVTYHDGRLMVTSTDNYILPIFGPSPANGSAGDSTTFRELGLERDVPAISSEDGKFGPELTVERSTVLGMVIAKRLKLVSLSIFADPLIADQRQEGCLRFSFVPKGSSTPKMYECIDGEDTWTEGLRFTSTRYGDPGYCQLSQLCASKIRQGDGGAERGVFHDLYQPQRETNARVRLFEHLKFGIEFGIFYST